MTTTRNVEAFEKLLGICTGYGGSYKPGHLNLQVENLSAMLEQARQALLDVHAAKTAYENATNNREVYFSDINRLCTRIIGALKASGALSQTVDDARVMTRKISGANHHHRNPLPVATPSGQLPKTRSTSERGFGSKASHFEKLLQTLSAEPLYQTDVQDLTVDELTERLAAYRKFNTDVIAAQVAWTNARTKRNALLYSAENNLVSTAIATKEYVKAVFGFRSEEFKQVSKIRFTKPIK